MFKGILFLASLLFVSSVEENNNDFKQFTNFQAKFNKFYNTIEEFEMRFVIFRTNLRNIILHNLDHSQNFTMGINQFTDLTAEEFKTQFTGGLKTEVGSYSCGKYSNHEDNLPEVVDWIKKGVVNPVRDQGQCGSCWAFATTANSESVWAIYSGKLLDLSEQYLVDCAT